MFSIICHRDYIQMLASVLLCLFVKQRRQSLHQFNSICCLAFAIMATDAQHNRVQSQDHVATLLATSKNAYNNVYVEQAGVTYRQGICSSKSKNV